MVTVTADGTVEHGQRNFKELGWSLFYSGLALLAIPLPGTTHSFWFDFGAVLISCGALMLIGYYFHEQLTRVAEYVGFLLFFGVSPRAKNQKEFANVQIAIEMALRANECRQADLRGMLEDRKNRHEPVFFTRWALHRADTYLKLRGRLAGTFGYDFVTK